MVTINPFPRSKRDISVIESVGDPAERHFGTISPVRREKESPDIHAYVYVVEATAERNYKRLVTSGMSEKPRTVPPAISEIRVDAADAEFLRSPGHTLALGKE